MAGSAKIGALHVALGLNSAQFTQGLANAQGALGKFGTIAVRGFTAVAAAATVAAGALAVATKGAIDQADALAKSAQKAGTTVEALSRLEYAAKLSDVSLESLTGGLQKLGKSMADAVATPTSTAATAFKALGIELTNADGTLRNSDVVLGEIAGKFARLEDGSTKTALAMQMFGKSGAELIPLLNGGADGLKRYADESDRLGITISTKTAKAAEKFNDTLTTIGQIMQGVVNKVMEAALPALQEFADALASPEFAAAAQTFATGIVTAMAEVVKWIASVKQNWKDLVDFVHHGVIKDAINAESKARWDKLKRPEFMDTPQGYAGISMLNNTFDAVGGNKTYGSTADMWKALTPEVITFGTEVKKAQEALDPFAARIQEMSGALTATVDPFSQMKLDLTDLTTMFEHGRIGADQFGGAVQKTIAGAVGSFSDLAGQALSSLSEIFQGNKALAAASAVVNGIGSIAKTLETYGVTPWGIAAAGVAAATAAANVASILSASETTKSMPGTTGALGGMSPPTQESGQSIYLTIKGSGNINVDEIWDQLAKSAADGGGSNALKIFREA